MSKPIPKRDAFFDSLDELTVPQKWFSTKEASSYLRMTPNALRIWVCRGKIRSYKVGSHLRFKLKDLECFLHNQGGHS